MIVVMPDPARIGPAEIIGPSDVRAVDGERLLYVARLELVAELAAELLASPGSTDAEGRLAEALAAIGISLDELEQSA